MPFRRAPNCATGPRLEDRSSYRRQVVTATSARADKGGRMVTSPVTPSLYSRWRGRRAASRGALVRQREPSGQQAHRFVRGLAVKRHHGRRQSGPAAQLGAPSIADGHRLDLVRPTANGFFEAMHDHGVWMVWGEKETSDDSTLRGGAIKRSETRRARAHGRPHEIVPADRANKFRCSGSPQVLHSPSTGFPQVE